MTPQTAISEELLRAVAADPALGPDLLSQDAADLQEYGKDWTRLHTPAPCAIAFPRTTAQVAALVRHCAAHKVPIVPSGGRTGLAGGAVAAQGELVLSLARMNRMDPVDPTAFTLRVQAGAVTQAVHEHAAAHGLTWPIDLAAKGSCHVGGNIATNAGGVRVIRYGLTRNWVLGLQVVTGTGEVLELNGALEKNNTGYDLRQLFIGSEGTLGVITEATLKLAPLPRGTDVFLFAVADLEVVLRLFHAARHSPLTLLAYEFMTRRCVELVCQARGARDPFAGSVPPDGAGCYVLLEVERPQVPGVLDAWLGEVLQQGLVLDGTLAQSPQQAQEIWSLREGIAESLFRAGLPHKNDVSLPIAALTAFCAELDRFFASRYPDWPVYSFGHIGDGNLHINVLKPRDLDTATFRARTSEVDHALFALVKAHRGSISAEHGIGLLKKGYLSYTRTPAELALMRALKRSFDPHGILNPGKVFDP
jgi:FAD/FMN-containing dehydrogenase